ncbi:MAG: dienelactone hydrolase family protein [Bacteroidetes bacterium]|nr:dienelactone hydrolase family protein [Bacteroidota bacterium]
MKTLSIFIPSIFFLLLVNCSGNVAGETKSDSVPDTTKVVATGKKISAPLKITFAAADGIIISADSYFSNDTLPWLLLCHQAGFSRGEYIETAPKLAELGYNCLAIDQRSGNEVNGVKNETAQRAKDAGRPTTYLDAEQDIIAAINYLYEQTKKPVILVGSSYSAGLVLKIATVNPLVKAVLAFSPGEYYGDKLNLAKTVSTLDKPVFITCSHDEIPDVRKIYDAIPSQHKTFFEPKSPGIHASRCLWETTDDYKEYWVAVKAFLKTGI